jgi:hypothetical protein
VDGRAARVSDTLDRAATRDAGRDAHEAAQSHRASFLEGGYDGGYEPDPYRARRGPASRTEPNGLAKHRLRPRPEREAVATALPARARRVELEAAGAGAVRLRGARRTGPGDRHLRGYRFFDERTSRRCRPAGRRGEQDDLDR